MRSPRTTLRASAAGSSDGGSAAVKGSVADGSGGGRSASPAMFITGSNGNSNSSSSSSITTSPSSRYRPLVKNYWLLAGLLFCALLALHSVTAPRALGFGVGNDSPRAGGRALEALRSAVEFVRYFSVASTAFSCEQMTYVGPNTSSASLLCSTSSTNFSWLDVSDACKPRSLPPEPGGAPRSPGKVAPRLFLMSAGEWSALRLAAYRAVHVAGNPSSFPATTTNLPWGALPFVHSTERMLTARLLLTPSYLFEGRFDVLLNATVMCRIARSLTMRGRTAVAYRSATAPTLVALSSPDGAILGVSARELASSSFWHLVVSRISHLGIVPKSCARTGRSEEYVSPSMAAVCDRLWVPIAVMDAGMQSAQMTLFTRPTNAVLHDSGRALALIHLARVQPSPLLLEGITTHNTSLMNMGFNSPDHMHLAGGYVTAFNVAITARGGLQSRVPRRTARLGNTSRSMYHYVCEGPANDTYPEYRIDELPLYEEVVVITHRIEANIYHWTTESMGKLAALLDYIRFRPHVKIHVGRVKSEALLLSSKFRHEHMHMLGINWWSRVISGYVRARVVHYPDNHGCGFPHAQWAILLRERYRTALGFDNPPLDSISTENTGTEGVGGWDVDAATLSSSGGVGERSAVGDDDAAAGVPLGGGAAPVAILAYSPASSGVHSNFNLGGDADGSVHVLGVSSSSGSSSGSGATSTSGGGGAAGAEAGPLSPFDGDGGAAAGEAESEEDEGGPTSTLTGGGRGLRLSDGAAESFETLDGRLSSLRGAAAGAAAATGAAADGDATTGLGSSVLSVLSSTFNFNRGGRRGRSLSATSTSRDEEDADAAATSTSVGSGTDVAAARALSLSLETNNVDNSSASTSSAHVEVGASTQVEVAPPAPKSIVFLRRKNTRKIANEGSLLRRMRALGKNVVNITEVRDWDMPSQDDIFRAVAGADLLIGAHGAGQTNSIVGRPGMCMIEFIPTEWLVMCYFRLSGHLGLKYNQFIVPGYRSSEIKIDIRRTMKAIKDCLGLNEGSGSSSSSKGGPAVLDDTAAEHRGGNSSSAVRSAAAAAKKGGGSSGSSSGGKAVTGASTGKRIPTREEGIAAARTAAQKVLLPAPSPDKAAGGKGSSGGSKKQV